MPTMLQMTSLQGKTENINIVEGIGVQWDNVGATLLDDKYGTIIPALARQYGNNAELINKEILRRWLQGRGIHNRTWQGLLEVLKVHCMSLAENVEEALTREAVTISQASAPSLPQSFVNCFTSCFRRQPEHSPLPPPQISSPSPHHTDTDVHTPPHNPQMTPQQQEAQQGTSVLITNNYYSYSFSFFTLLPHCYVPLSTTYFQEKREGGTTARTCAVSPATPSHHSCCCMCIRIHS